MRAPSFESLIAAATSAPTVAEKAKTPAKPAAPPAAPTLSELLEMVDAVESAIGKLPTEDQSKAVQRIVDLADLLTAPAKPKAAKPAKVLAAK